MILLLQLVRWEVFKYLPEEWGAYYIYLIIGIIGTIVNIIVLIVFFIMASNVSAIKRELQKKLSFDDYIEKYNEEKYVGNKPQAKEWLLRAQYYSNKEYEMMKDNSSEWEKADQEKTTKRQLEKISNLLKELESDQPIQ